jgi:peptidoglycan/xylan/chitin deacetylase (PgdA/CDA1 family)
MCHMRLRTQRLPAMTVIALLAVLLASCATALAPAVPTGGRALPATAMRIDAAPAPLAAPVTPSGRSLSFVLPIRGSSMASIPAVVVAGSPVTTGPPPAGFRIRLPVFMYHRVAPDAEMGGSLPDLVVNPRRFAAQMDALQRAGWTTITAGTLAADLAAGRQPPPHSFVLTFDDGHEDGYTHAFPVLRRLGFVATFYVISGRIDRTGYLTSAELRDMSAAGMEIGSHTVRHIDLTRLTSGGVTAQLGASARTIQAVVGVRPRTLAYPFGRWDRGLAAPLAATGYRLAFIEGGTCARVTWETRYSIARLRVERATSPGAVLAGARACAG